MSDRIISDICVCGGGPTGFAAALAMARAGRRVIILAPETAIPPGRTAALLEGSIAILQELGAWHPDRLDGAPLRAIRLIDDTGALIRAPEVTFHASEIGLQSFGHNIPNALLVDCLRSTAAGVPNIEIVDERAEDICTDDKQALLVTQSGTEIGCELIVAADGAKSLAREAAGIGTREWSYDQSALITTLATELPHNGTSTEFHTGSGPLTLVPLGPRRISLVWMQDPQSAAEATRLPVDKFNELLERRTKSIHGRLNVDSERVAVPLRGLLSEQFAARRVMLVGEAAHVFPPIGAQWLNLGLRDVAALSRVLRRHPAPGSEAALLAYGSARQVDVRTRTYAVDLLNRSLLSPFLPFHLVRSSGLFLASAIPPLRRFLMRRGLSDVTALV